MLITPAFAQGSLFGGADSSGMITSLLPLILIVVIMYFLVLRLTAKNPTRAAGTVV